MFDIPSTYVIVSSTVIWLSLMIFYAWGKHKSYDEVKDEIIENTILYLVNEGYLKSSRDENGEIELHKIDEEK